MCNFHIFRYFPLILVMLCSSAASLGLAQEAPGGSLEPESGMTDFYERQKMDEELRALRGDLDKITKRLADIEKAQDLIHELMLKVSNIEGQLQLGDGSQSSLANMLKSLKGDLKQLSSKVNLLDADIRTSLEVLAGDLSSGSKPPVQAESVDKPVKTVDVSVPVDSAVPVLDGEIKDAKIFYEYAKGLYDKGSYNESIPLFKALHEAFPENQYAKSGLYWSAKALTKSDYKSLEALNVLKQLVPRLKNHNKQCVATLDAGTIHLERRECTDAKKYLIDAKKTCARDAVVHNQSLPQKRLTEYTRYCDDE